jgi:hypothetical protein
MRKDIVSGVLVRQALTSGESRRAASVLSRMREVAEMSAVRHRLGVCLTDATLGRSSDGPYVYYRIEPDRDGAVAGRSRAVLKTAADQFDAIAEVVNTYNRLTEGTPIGAEFTQEPDTEPTDIERTARRDSQPAED